MNIEQFELQYQNARRVTVWQFVGKPELKPLAQIPAKELESELDKLMDLLESQSVIVHFDRKVSVDGMRHNFIYSEMHPEPTIVIHSSRKGRKNH